MIRELNFTNRGTMLDRFDAWLYMVGESGSSRKLWDVRVKLRPEGIAELQSELGFGDEWECWVEVYKSSRVERFKLGEGKLADRMDDRFATGFDSEVYPLLRIKLVATNDPMHKILASKDRINPVTIDAGGRREHLLPLRYEEIGQVPWYVREPGGNRPRLVVNANLHRPGETAEDLVKDKLFKALVLPEAYRQIFDKLLSVQTRRSESLLDFMDILRGWRSSHDDDIDGDDYRRKDSADDRVQIMTMHASKGLEFPFVIIGSGFSDFIKSKYPVQPYTDSDKGGRRVCAVDWTEEHEMAYSKKAIAECRLLTLQNANFVNSILKMS